MKDEDKTKEELTKELKFLREEREKGVFKDIAPLTQAEEELQKSEEKWRSLVNILPDYISLLDPEGRFLFLNHYANGFTEKEVIGSSVYQYFSPESKEIFKKEMAECQNTEKMRKFEHTAMGDHGIMRAYEDYLVPIFENNQVTSVMVISRDITERKQAEESLKKIVQVLNDTGKMAKVGGWELDLLTQEVSWTEEVYLIHGVKPGNKIMLEEALNFYAPEYRSALEEALNKTAETGEPLDLVSLFIPSGSKDKIWVRSMGKAVYQDGKIVKLVGTFQNIDEYKQVEGALKKANLKLRKLDQAKTMFIASMSHELRTPLTLILSCTDIMLQEISGEINQEQRKQLTLVKKNTNHLLDLVNDSIDINKIEVGIVDITIEEFDLSALSQEIKDAFSIIADKKGLALSLEAPPTLLIESDRRRTKQILVNLLSNALKFTNRGEIKIKIAAKDQTVETTVRDNGIGIKKEDRDKIFIAFGQIPHPERIKEGTGLGLYISKKNANLLGGDIMAESEFGKGSVFTLILPLKYKEDKA